MTNRLQLHLQRIAAKREETEIRIATLLSHLYEQNISSEQFDEYVREIDRYQEKRDVLRKAFSLLEEFLKTGTGVTADYCRRDPSPEAVALAYRMLGEIVPSRKIAE